ncbi:MAG: hypothetical protein SFY80_07870 [Verrucomicrobiota bacterium]|nr:hypothetical protein [Verrucomicrobiota bacterium]
MALHRIISFALVFVAGCVSEQGDFNCKNAAGEMAASQGEVALIVQSAAKAYNLVVVGISQDEPDVISVYLAESCTASGGPIVFF